MNDTDEQYDATGGLTATQPMVVALSEYRTDSGGKIVEEIVEYWQGLRNGVAVPRRTDIDPRAIKQHLEHAFILERVAPGIARFRVAGRTLNNLLGMDARGMTVSALIGNDDRAEFSTMLEEVFQGPTRVNLTLIVQGPGGVRAKCAIMPLKSDLGDVSRALGVIEVDGVLSDKTPHRFTIVRKESIPLLGDRPSKRSKTDSKPKAPVADKADQQPSRSDARKALKELASRQKDRAHLSLQSDDEEEASSAIIRDRIAKHRRSMLRVIEGNG